MLYIKMDSKTNQTYDHAWLAKEVRECLETCEFFNDVNVKIHITGNLKMKPLPVIFEYSWILQICDRRNCKMLELTGAVNK